MNIFDILITWLYHLTPFIIGFFGGTFAVLLTHYWNRRQTRLTESKYSLLLASEIHTHKDRLEIVLNQLSKAKSGREISTPCFLATDVWQEARSHFETYSRDELKAFCSYYQIIQQLNFLFLLPNTNHQVLCKSLHMALKCTDVVLELTAIKHDSQKAFEHRRKYQQYLKESQHYEQENFSQSH
ncbi:hypothetical protein [Megasphaera sp.]|uniref:hypothetical protein n=1 Tax=Megasphaera sp. TaxID=2023260 RepID=UPI00352176B7